MKVQFVQLNSEFAEQHYLPLSACMLTSAIKAFAKSTSSLNFLPILFKFEPIDIMFEKCRDADILCLSVYVWNLENSLRLARRYKAHNPNGVVIVGGPQVPNSRKQFRRIRSAELNDAEKEKSRVDFTQDFIESIHILTTLFMARASLLLPC